MFGWISRMWMRLKGSSTPTESASTHEPKPPADVLMMVASSQESKSMPPPSDTCTVENKTGQEIEYNCGHRCAKQFTISLFGESLEPSDAGHAQSELCAECLLAKLRPSIIRCALCGFGIMPGDRVAAYADNGKFKKEWKTTIGDGEKKGVIGCMRWECCPSGGFFAGHWMGDHFVSAFAAGCMVAEVFQAGKSMHVDGDGEITYIEDTSKKNN